MKRTCFFLSLLILVLAGCQRDIAEKAAEEGQALTPEEQHAEAVQWFEDAQFGMFIHWGVYSVLGDGEWVMQNHKMTVAEYEKLPPQFNPVKFDPKEWVSLAKEAGMKYITITSKHHDGFAMWDSDVSDYDIVDRTPYGKDVLKMLADECERQGIKLFFYHSQLDWHHPDYYPRGRTGQYSARPDSGDFDRYLDYMNAQIAELASGEYGKIAGFWFDGWWDQQVEQGDTATHVNWHLKKTYDLIHRLQPQALVGNNHHIAPFPGEDFQMFERDLPGQKTAGFNEGSTVSTLPLETADTMNKSWGYNKNDHDFKSPTELIHYLVRAAGYNANLLLNIGPRPDGTFQPEVVERLHAIGKWTKRNGETIYATEGGPMPPQDWGVTTRKDGVVYLHVLDPDAPASLTLPNTAGLQVAKATLFADGSDVAFSKPSDVTVDLPVSKRDSVDTIVVLQLEDDS
ncbi:MAG TPA: alpha-L-fucosidase [Rhodothermales bacterium]|nr:alpha-L-fucosidase [Rhodothermales bacterium]